MKIINYFFQSIAVYSFFLIGKILGLRISRKIFAWIFLTFGSIFKSKKIIERNLKVFSNKSPQLNEKLICSKMWRNYGMTFIEYVFLNYFRKQNSHISIENDENLLLLGMNTDVVIEVLNKEVSLSTPTMSLRTRKDIYTASSILNIPKETIDNFLVKKVDGENFNSFIVIKETKKGPELTWVKIGISDLSNVEIVSGLDSKDTVFILPSKSLFDYQKRFRERLQASFSFG